MNDYDILNMLESDNTQEVQKMGLNMARDAEDISCFIQPLTPLHNKGVWENCAKIISARSDEELYPYLDDILEWLQDLTWPGTFLIIDRLKCFNGEMLYNAFVKSIYKAESKQYADYDWLSHLTKLLENAELVKIMDNTLYSKLKKIYNEFWTGLE